MGRYIKPLGEMSLMQSDTVMYLVFDRLHDMHWLTHGFSTRIGGVSKDKYAELNLGLYTKDDRNDVLVNLELFSRALYVKRDNMVALHQVHGNTVYKATTKLFGRGVIRKVVGDGDALISNEAVPLMTYHADCTPIFFVDERNKAVGVAHAGWRGTVSLIVKETAEAMARNFGTRYEDLICAIGPAICKTCFECDDDVLDGVKQSGIKIDEKLVSTYDGKHHIDLALMNKRILLDLGVDEENILLSNLCTKCNPEYFYSHRLEGAERGVMAACISIK